MAVKIQVKRGKKAGLPTLAPGEYGLATDTGELFIGGPDGNIQVAVLGSDHKLPSDHLPAHRHGAGDITSGTLGVARGGTGQTTLTPAVDTVALRASYAGTTDLTAGSSALTTGALYFVYE